MSTICNQQNLAIVCHLDCQRIHKDYLGLLIEGAGARDMIASITGVPLVGTSGNLGGSL